MNLRPAVWTQTKNCRIFLVTTSIPFFVVVNIYNVLPSHCSGVQKIFHVTCSFNIEGLPSLSE
jgi:hypothetical protein